jgi:hypothetical protein
LSFHLEKPPPIDVVNREEGKLSSALSMHRPDGSKLFFRSDRSKGGLAHRPAGSNLGDANLRMYASLQESLPGKFTHDYVKFIDTALPLWIELLEAQEKDARPLTKGILRRFNDQIWAGRLTPASELIEPICTTVPSLEGYVGVVQLTVRPFISTRQ